MTDDWKSSLEALVQVAVATVIAIADEYPATGAFLRVPTP